jgi:hypothetical protein
MEEWQRGRGCLTATSSQRARSVTQRALNVTQHPGCRFNPAAYGWRRAEDWWGLTALSQLCVK